MTMRWLQWSTCDLAEGLGGVETHARAVHRELAGLGIESRLSSDASDLENSSWDVIHTHGSAPLPSRFMALRALWHPNAGRKPVHVHTLHGTTWGRMASCREWAWPGGYLAGTFETASVCAADVVLAVQPRLSLLALARRLGKATAVCWNGWDAAAVPAPLPDAAALEKARPFWIFLGRGSDRVKGADRLAEALKAAPDLRLVAAPGEGFEGSPAVIQTGRLDPGQVQALMGMAAGLILPSRYEGLPLVVLEALAQGLPVVATAVGGVQALPSGLQGLVLLEGGAPHEIVSGVRRAEKLDPAGRGARAAANRGLLSSWRQVAETAVAAVRRLA